MSGTLQILQRGDPAPELSGGLTSTVWHTGFLFATEELRQREKKEDEGGERGDFEGMNPEQR